MASTVTPDNSASYFLTPSLKGLVQQLTHLAFFGDGLSVVVGFHGSGKSALATQLITHLDSAHNVARLDLASPLELVECIERVLRALGLIKTETLSVGEMLAELRHYVQSLAQEKKLVALIIDDAHYLDDQAIGALLSLLQGCTDTNFGLHLVLLSEPGLETRIDALQIIDVPLYDFEMPSFSPSEMANFLNERVTIETPLSSAQIQKIWVNSKGLPGVAMALISEKSTEEPGRRVAFLSAIPIGHISAIVVLALILIWSVFFRGDQRQRSVLPVSVAPATEKSPDAGESGVETSVVTEEQVNSSLDGNESEGLGVTAPDETGSIAINNTLESLGETIEVQQIPVKPETTSQPDAISLSPAVQDEASVIGGSESQNAIQISSPSEILLETKQVQVVLTDAERFLMDQDPSAYVLQVVAASRKASLDAYIAQQPNKDSLHMYRGTREGKSWFVVVQGVYNTRQLALDARQSLPEEQAKAGPWPRKISTIQEEIETFRRNYP